jgi:hypothetical protein
MTGDDKAQAVGPTGETDDRGRKPERYPTVRQDDAVEQATPARTAERRSFDPVHDAPPSTDDGPEGPSANGGEGKR